MQLRRAELLADLFRQLYWEDVAVVVVVVLEGAGVGGVGGTGGFALSTRYNARKQTLESCNCVYASSFNINCPPGRVSLASCHPTATIEGGLCIILLKVVE